MSRTILHGQKISTGLRWFKHDEKDEGPGSRYFLSKRSSTDRKSPQLGNRVTSFVQWFQYTCSAAIEACFHSCSIQSYYAYSMRCFRFEFLGCRFLLKRIIDPFCTNRKAWCFTIALMPLVHPHWSVQNCVKWCVFSRFRKFNSMLKQVETQLDVYFFIL